MMSCVSHGTNDAAIQAQAVDYRHERRVFPAIFPSSNPFAVAGEPAIVLPPMLAAQMALVDFAEAEGRRALIEERRRWADVGRRIGRPMHEKLEEFFGVNWRQGKQMVDQFVIDVLDEREGGVARSLNSAADEYNRTDTELRAELIAFLHGVSKGWDPPLASLTTNALLKTATRNGYDPGKPPPESEEPPRAPWVKTVLAAALEALERASAAKFKLAAVREGSKNIVLAPDDDSGAIEELCRAAAEVFGLELAKVKKAAEDGKDDAIEAMTAPPKRPKSGDVDDSPFGQPARGSEDWKKRALRNKNGMLCNVTNVLLALEAMFPDTFTWDEFACCVKINREKVVVETDVIELQTLLQKEGLANLQEKPIYSALSVRAKYKSFHPVKEEIESVAWDGVKRVERFTIDYLGCEDTPYNRAVGRMFLISMVARVYEPGCQADYVLVLEGPQGEVKSSAVRALTGPKYFSDQIPDLTNKDSSQHMRDKWAIELGEMSRFHGVRGTNQLKAFITRRTEKYRPPYGRLETTEDRQCVFFGTINPIGGSGYFEDPTGNRRWWPIAVGIVKKIDLDAIEEDRLQIFAETLVLYRQGEPWWPDAEFERQYIEPEQDDRQEDDIWTDVIEGWLIRQRCCGRCERKNVIIRGRMENGCLGTTPGEVAELALKIGVNQETGQTDFIKLGRSQQNLIMASLARLGWERGKRTGSGRWWVPTDKWFRRFKAAPGTSAPPAADSPETDDVDDEPTPF